ncbi:developmental regulatory protein WetA [Aspergillus mulundensis]|uniref:Developmental regulatory protein wetA n=1 Tax=Aspergillus mulundensis TaxID=1810919 RepID=A0A3D8S498_9EURO|nr:Developmental regulatory protein wetA [Aspergillus mulundensis]RDW81133.1 Developmental regulatory protein wetA [Aspergillus mulundensis]
MDTSSTDASKDVQFSSEFDQIFPLDSFATDCGDQSPIISTAQLTRQSTQDWSKDLWSLSQNTGCSTDQDNFSLQDSTQPSAVLGLNLDLDAASAGHSQASVPRSSPSTPPATPGSKVKGGLFTPKTIRRHRESNDHRGLLRKQSFSPGLMRSSQLQKGSYRMAYPEAWAQRLQNFTIRSSDEGLPLSPPPSDILVQRESISKHTAAQMNNSAENFQGSTELPQQFDSGYMTQSPAIPMPSPSVNALASQHQRYLNQSNTSTLTPSPPSAGGMFSSPHSSDPQSMSSWHSDSLGTSAFHYTPELNDPQTWWSPMPSEVTQRHASYQHIIASPAPQRPIQASANHGDLLQGGLMIQLDPTQFDFSSSFPSSAIPTTANTQDSHSYNFETHAPQTYVDSTSFTTPNIPNPSRSPSISPKTGTSPTQRRDGMVLKNTPRRHHGRNLSGQSTNIPKPVKAPTNLSTSPKADKSVTVSFVNFTANDSQKILTGVAPSGSSKTKARREQEARDRRRKLSEAALQAVRKAGGDVEALEAVFC